MQDCHPVLLKNLTMKENLKSMLAELSGRSQTEIRLTCRDDMFLVDPYYALVFRMIRELIQNALKYADDFLIRVFLDEEKGMITLRIHDDGIGFDTEISPGHGLASIQEQTELLGGRMHIQSASGQGTTAEITIPMEGDRSYEDFISR